MFQSDLPVHSRDRHVKLESGIELKMFLQRKGTVQLNFQLSTSRFSSGLQVRVSRTTNPPSFNVQVSRTRAKLES